MARLKIESTDGDYSIEFDTIETDGVYIITKGDDAEISSYFPKSEIQEVINFLQNQINKQ